MDWEQMEQRHAIDDKWDMYVWERILASMLDYSMKFKVDLKNLGFWSCSLPVFWSY
jgi:hypothetical protein